MGMKRTPLKRTGPPARKSPLKRKARMKPQNRARRTRERERAYGPPERRKWLTRQPCVSCGVRGTDDRPNHQHHVESGGTGRKADADTLVSLCATCHRLEHDGNLTRDIDWTEQARRTEAAWQDYLREETTS